MRVLVACEHTGVVRRAFEARGHDAWSCDLLPAEDGGKHIQGDVLEILGDHWDLMIAHPPCTYLCSSGLFWNKKRPERAQKTEEALEFVRALMDAPIPRWCIENPVGCISTRIRKPDQYVQPYEFGHDASKRTGLWLHNLPKLEPTSYVEPRIITYKGREYKRWANQAPCGADKTPPGPDRWKKRSATYEGIANAMADQWTPLHWPPT